MCVCARACMCVRVCFHVSTYKVYTLETRQQYTERCWMQQLPPKLPHLVLPQNHMSACSPQTP